MTILLPSTSLMLKFTIDANMNLVLRNFPDKMRDVGKGPGVEVAQIFFVKFSLSSKYIFLFDYTQRGRVLIHSPQAGFHKRRNPSRN